MKANQLTDRLAVRSFEETINGVEIVRTIYTYKNPNGTVSLCSDVIMKPVMLQVEPVFEKRTKRKEA
jgi:hypothetical protein